MDSWKKVYGLVAILWPGEGRGPAVGPTAGPTPGLARRHPRPGTMAMARAVQTNMFHNIRQYQ